MSAVSGRKNARRVQRSLRARDGDRCGICLHLMDFEAEPGNDDSPSIDHVIPRSAGGTNALANLRLTHVRCNNERGANERGARWAWSSSTPSKGSELTCIDLIRKENA